MPGRITDELRRITREQGGVTPPPDAPARPEPRGSRHGPLVALAVVLVLAVVGWWIVRRVMEMSRLQDCVMSGRKNCAPVDTGGTEK